MRRLSLFLRAVYPVVLAAFLATACSGADGADKPGLAGDDARPAEAGVSPDGRWRLEVIVDFGGQMRGIANSPDENPTAALYVVSTQQSEGEAERRLIATSRTEAAPEGFQWSPDGSRLIYNWPDLYQSCVQRSCSVRSRTRHFLTSLDGSVHMRLETTSEFGSDYAWAPDGSKLLYQDAGDIFTLNADGTGRRRLTGDSAVVIWSAPRWSPDGSRILHVREIQGNSEIFVMNADGSHPRNLSKHTANDSYPRWSPDGRLIAFRRYNTATRRYDLFVMGADGSEQRSLLAGTATVEPGPPFWSADGGQVLFRNLRSTQLHTIRLGRVDVHSVAVR